MSEKKKQIIKFKKCPECGCKNLDDDKNELTCTQCGLVLQGTNPYVGLRKIEYPLGYYV